MSIPRVDQSNRATLSRTISLPAPQQMDPGTRFGGRMDTASEASLPPCQSPIHPREENNAIRNGISVGEISAHAVSPRPPNPSDSSVACTEGYTYAARVWALCVAQGRLSVAPPCQTPLADPQLVHRCRAGTDSPSRLTVQRVCANPKSNPARVCVRVQQADAGEAEGPVWLPASPHSRTAAQEARPGNAVAGLNARRLARAISEGRHTARDTGEPGDERHALARMSLTVPENSTPHSSAVRAPPSAAT
jgi:hypothetical protein